MLEMHKAPFHPTSIFCCFFGVFPFCLFLMNSLCYNNKLVTGSCIRTSFNHNRTWEKPYSFTFCYVIDCSAWLLWRLPKRGDVHSKRNTVRKEFIVCLKRLLLKNGRPVPCLGDRCQVASEQSCMRFSLGCSWHEKAFLNARTSEENLKGSAGCNNSWE